MSTSPAHAPWPVDAHGRLLPAVPTRLTLYAGANAKQWPCDEFRVYAASGRAFRVRTPHGDEWHPASEWGAFLDGVVAAPHVTMHLPGCDRGWCSGCDGSAIGRGAPVTGAAQRATPSRDTMNPLHAGVQAARRYTFQRVGSVQDDTSCEVVFQVQGAAGPWQIRVCPRWSHRPLCECGDAGGVVYCEHVTALLLQEPALRCQLLEVLF